MLKATSKVDIKGAKIKLSKEDLFEILICSSVSTADAGLKSGFFYVGWAFWKVNQLIKDL